MNLINRIVFFPFRRLRLYRSMYGLHFHGLKELARFQKCLTDAGFISWLDFGTLLGIIRDKQLLKFDADIDLAVPFADDMDNINQLFQYGYKCICIGVGVSSNRIYKLKFKRNGVIIDVSFYYHFGNKKNLRFTALEIGAEWQSRVIRDVDIKQMHLNGLIFWLPSFPEEYLEAHYGPSYKYKNTQWSDSESQDLEPLDEHVNLVYAPIKKVSFGSKNND